MTLYDLLAEWYESREVSNRSSGADNLAADRRYGKACDDLAEFLAVRPLLRRGVEQVEVTP